MLTISCTFAHRMRRFFIYFSYDGTRYHGWQVQPNAPSVQAEIERALSLLFRTCIRVTGAGRTDTGVHARMMVAHFDYDGEIDGKQLTYRMNRILPQDIAVNEVVEVAPDLHARFSAVSRNYHYYIHTHRDPFLRYYSLETHYPLDFNLMNEAAFHLIGAGDFGAFCKSHADVKTTLCKVTEARWVQTSPTTWYFSITANRFLRNMVRAIVGTLFDVGRGRITLEEFDKIVEGKRRTDAGESMPGNALFLERIEY